MSENSPVAPTSRRSFLDYFLGLSVLGWMGSAIYPVIRFLKPLPISGPGGPIRLSSDEAQKLEREKMIILRAGSQRVLVFQDETRKVRALSARCTHEGCTVKFLPGESIIWCACHNAKFDVDGRVLSGPPPKPLPKFSAQREDNGAVMITVEKV